MPHIHTDYWSLEVPDDWQVERDEETSAVSISDPDDIGCLDLLVVETETQVDEQFLKSFIAESVLDEEVRELPELKEAEISSFGGFSLSYIDDDLSWREWYLVGEQWILMITYNTELEQAGLDDPIVDQILETLVQEPGANN